MEEWRSSYERGFGSLPPGSAKTTIEPLKVIGTHENRMVVAPRGESTVKKKKW